MYVFEPLVVWLVERLIFALNCTWWIVEILNYMFDQSITVLLMIKYILCCFIPLTCFRYCVSVCAHVCEVFVVDLYILLTWGHRLQVKSSAEESLSPHSWGKSVLTYLQLISAGFSEPRENFHKFGLKQCVAGLHGQGFYTCYERKGAYEFLGCLGLSENLHIRVERASQ